MLYFLKNKVFLKQSAALLLSGVFCGPRVWVFTGAVLKAVPSAHVAKVCFSLHSGYFTALALLGVV